MTNKKRNNNEPWLLKGEIEYFDDRANILYNHPDNNPESSTEILAARRLQDTNDIIPYFEIIDIIIPREIAKDLLY